MSIISKDIRKAINLLQEDQLVAIPTETVYGLAGNIFSEVAIGKIFKTKNRPHFNPLIVHIPSVSKLDQIVSHVPEKAKQLADTFWPGSLTLILPKSEKIPDLITAGKDTVGVRVPNHPTTLELLNQLPFPVAAPSANPFNRISPTKPEHVANYFEGKIQMVLDGGACEKGLESTIIGFENEEPIVYRLGAISLEDIEAVIGKVAVRNTKENRPDAPGMLLKHYAPKTKIVLSDNIDRDLQQYASEKIGILGFENTYKHASISHQETLSSQGNLQEAATNLYQALHRLDEQDLTLILAEKFPDEGLGKTINDRLKRASS
ncbi:MAG: threonylcarbamoyl-AMP synthase [Flavobacteriaceae bacterium]|nr:threonylcarbamoyl-AMP synthase [Flavobacteriaceae bacterium]|tara:strand:+ start:67045 stop:68001 length:957 start_codon:yes stop_codon:yes gene_type:complete